MCIIHREYWTYISKLFICFFKREKVEVCVSPKIQILNEVRWGVAFSINRLFCHLVAKKYKVRVRLPFCLKSEKLFISAKMFLFCLHQKPKVFESVKSIRLNVQKNNSNYTMQLGFQRRNPQRGRQANAGIICFRCKTTPCRKWIQLVEVISLLWFVVVLYPTMTN